MHSCLAPSVKLSHSYRCSQPCPSHAHHLTSHDPCHTRTQHVNHRLQTVSHVMFDARLCVRGNAWDVLCMLLIRIDRSMRPTAANARTQHVTRACAWLGGIMLVTHLLGVCMILLVDDARVNIHMHIQSVVPLSHPLSRIMARGKPKKPSTAPPTSTPAKPKPKSAKPTATSTSASGNKRKHSSEPTKQRSVAASYLAALQEAHPTLSTDADLRQRLVVEWEADIASSLSEQATFIALKKDKTSVEKKVRAMQASSV